MTKENREKAYAHFRKLETSYEAREGLNTGLTSTTVIRVRAKKNADALLKRNPELEIKPEPVKEIKKTKKNSRGE